MKTNITNIHTFDQYLQFIGGDKDSLVAIWETGSYLEGVSDKFSDRDFAFIWEKTVPTASLRLKAANKLGFEVHEIKDVPQIGMSFDMFSDGEFLFNIGHGTKEKEPKWYEALNGEKLPSDLEEILMSISALERGKIYYQKDSWVDKLLAKIKLTDEIKDKIIKHYSNKVSVDLKLLQKSSSRNDFLQFIKYLHKVLRSMQIIYLLQHNKPVVSEKFFDKRFAKIENGEITKLIRNISSQVDIVSIYKDTLNAASNLGIKQSEKFKA